ncbi:hypothetical protein ACSSNL_04430 [Thalassobius sp. S69A]|uniref:hypothetical protein n=1 Tax=unclassified Thalassovita TaxID=2619711 RepID=UPI003C7C855D
MKDTFLDLLQAPTDLERGPDGRIFTKTEQTRMCGNSVPPVMAEALVSANVPELAVVA